MSVRSELKKAWANRLLRLHGRWRRRMNLRGQDNTIVTYNLMKADNQIASDLYKAGAFWSKINQDFIDLIWAGALVDLRNQYFNRRFSGPDPCSRQVYSALLWLYYSNLQQIDTDGFLKSAFEPFEGGTADQELVDGRPMSLDFLQSIDEAYRLRYAWKLSKRPKLPQIIVELGAGYGRLAYICRKMIPDCTYVILDLPEALICSSTWLNQVLPGEVVPYTDSRHLTNFDREVLSSRKVWILSLHQIEQIAPGTVDAFINIYSFAEMPIQSINNYFSVINRIADGIFYSKQRKLEHNITDNIEVNLDTYPIQPHWNQLFFQTSTLYESFFEVAYDLKPKSNL